MELVLRSDNRTKLEKVIAFAKKLNIAIEEKDLETTSSAKDREALASRIQAFKGGSVSSFGDALEWQRDHREDRSLPF